MCLSPPHPHKYSVHLTSVDQVQIKATLKKPREYVQPNDLFKGDESFQKYSPQ